MAKTVIFDLGGVVFDWNARYLYQDYFENDAAIEAFFAEVDFFKINLRCDASSWQKELPQLALEYPEHIALLKAYGDHYLKSVRGQFEGTIQVIEALKAKGITLYALTNWAADTFKVTVEAYPNLHDFFSDILVSGNEGITKPDPKIYQMALSRWGIAASETYFVDDSVVNVAGANQVGIHGIHFTTPEKLHSELVQLALL